LVAPKLKLKLVLEFVSNCLAPLKIQGLIFAYDETQNLSDQASKEQYPLGGFARRLSIHPEKRNSIHAGFNRPAVASQINPS